MTRTQFIRKCVRIPALLSLLSLAAPATISGQVQWKSATSNPGFDERAYHGSVVFDNKLWVLHGQRVSGGLDDIWYTTTGSSWTRATSSVPYPMRCGLGLLVFNNYMWHVAGGVNC